MRHKFNWKKSVLFASVFACARASASSVADHSASELVDYADVIIEGRTTKIEGICEASRCWALVELTLASTLKGSLTKLVSEKVSFCTDIPLRLGDQYLVFLVSRDDIGCTLAALPDGVLQHKDSKLYRYFSPDSLQLVEKDGNEFWTAMRRDKQMEYLLKLQIKADQIKEKIHVKKGVKDN